MVVGLKTKASGNADLDAVFDPYVQGTSPPATGFNVGGTTTDIHERFAPIVFGSQAAATGLQTKQSGNADLNTLFAAFGTAVYSLPINGQTFSGLTTGTQSSAMLASAKIIIKANGTYSVLCIGNSTASNPASGTWLPSGAVASDYQVQFAYVQNSQLTDGPATITNSASVYTACTSDQSFETSATVAQHGGLEKGGNYTVTIRLKRLSTGTVNTTTITFVVQSVGAA